MKTKKAKLFNLRLFPMDFGRIMCSPMPLFFNIKKLYISPEAEKKVTGGALISANHTGFSDPVLIGNCFWYRRMFFLAAKEVTNQFFFGPLMRLAGCITIDRDICDMTAIKKSVALLKEGHTLAVFPQGAISKDDMNSIKGGIILMAMQAKVPVIPVYIHKKEGKGDRNCVVIGSPINLFDYSKAGMPSMAEIQSAAELVLEKMIDCRSFYENNKGAI